MRLQTPVPIRVLTALLFAVFVLAGLPARGLDTVYTFQLGGRAPQAGPYFTNGNLYVPTYSGGSNGYGTITELTNSGSQTNVYSLGYTNGVNPQYNLVSDGNGNFYGTCYQGGSRGLGSIYELSGESLANVISFTGTNGASEGAFPQCGLVHSESKNSLYGTTSAGGPVVSGKLLGFGTIFELQLGKKPAFTTLHKFKFLDGSVPQGALLMESNELFGTTAQGGYTSNGVIFKISLQKKFDLLHVFDFYDGAVPCGGLVKGPSGLMYGVTSSGGSISSNGTIFSIDAKGNFTSLFSFDGINGSTPQAGLVALTTNGPFYGTTYVGGIYGLGTVFQVTTEGILTSLASFNNINGANPQGVLVSDGAGNLYGTTVNGGLYGAGTVFEINTNGELSTLLSFSPGSGYPEGGLLATNGALYGTAAYGGPTNAGLVFGVIPTNILELQVPFSGANSSFSSGSLCLGSDTNFYGTTYDGGSSNVGSIFRVTTNGVVSNLFSFVGTNGSHPAGGLYQATDGNFYGTTSQGGPTGTGTFFRLVVMTNIGLVNSGVTNAAVTNTFATNTVVTNISGIITNGAFIYVTNINGTNIAITDVFVTTFNGTNISTTINIVTNTTVIDLTLTNNPILASSTATNIAVTNAIVTNMIITNINGTSLYVTNITITDVNVTFFNGTNINTTNSSVTNVTVNESILTSNVPMTATNITQTNAFATNISVTDIVITNINGTNFVVTNTTLTNFTVIDFSLTSFSGTNVSTTTNGSVTNMTVTEQSLTNGVLVANSIVTNVAVTNMIATNANMISVIVTNINGTNTVVTNSSVTNYTVTSITLSNFNGTNITGTTSIVTNGSGTSAYMTNTTVTNFLVTTNVFTSLAPFIYDVAGSGAFPEGPLVQIPGTNGISFYGTTYAGGTNNCGTVFMVTSNGILSNVASFGGGVGSYPETGLIYDSGNSNYYGTTSSGGNGFGTIFQMTTDGELTMLCAFAETNGANPQGPLVTSGNGLYYGTAQAGGALGYGSVFCTSLMSSTVTNLYSFSWRDGAYPNGGLTFDSNGVLYGTTAQGGSNGVGTVFSVMGTNLIDPVLPLGVTDATADLANMPGITEAVLSAGASQLILLTVGGGAIEHSVWPKELALGGRYTVKAVAKPGYLFQSWSGGTNSPYQTLSTSPLYAFEMQSNLVLEASFLADIFATGKGTYNGLFEAGGVLRAQNNSGAFHFDVTATGAFSGELRVGSATVPLSGKFGADGSTEVTNLPEGNRWVTSLQLDTANHSVNGTISNTGFTAELLGYQNVFSAQNKASNYAGRYTLVIPGVTNPALGPYGTGCGTLTVSSSGEVSFAGSLADGTPITESSAISPDGFWPFYINLYNGTGSIWAWNFLQNGGINGSASWIKIGNASKASMQTTGFTNQSATIAGAFYDAANALAPGLIINLETGDLTNSLTTSNLKTNKATGVITGTVADPAISSQSIKINAVILQTPSGTNAQGYFLDNGQSGVFMLGQP